MSSLLRCTRSITPLLNGSGQCLRARGGHFARDVSGVRYGHSREVLNRNGAGAALAARDEVMTISAGSCLQSGLDSGPLLESTRLKLHVMPRGKALKVEGESGEYPLSEDSILEVGNIELDMKNENLTAHMPEHGCDDGYGAGELLKSMPSGSSVTNSTSLQDESDGVFSAVNDSQEFRGVRDQSQVDDSCESGLIGTVSSFQAVRNISSSSLQEGRSVDIKESNPVSLEVTNDVELDHPVVRFGSQNGLVSDVANATESSPQYKVSEPQGALPEYDGVVEKASEYPVPLSPFSGEIERAIEYERAMVAETAMKSGPAISRSDVLFEDEWLIVINKPCGIYSEHVLATIPSLLQTTASLASESLLKDENVSIDETHLHMANRLDRDTSGVMVITKCRKAAGNLSRIFSNRRVQKSYIALCAAPPPTWRHLTIESGHGRSRFGAWRVYAKRDIGRTLPGKCVVRDMRTHFMVVAINKEIVAEQMESGGIPTVCSSLEELKTKHNVLIAGEEDMNEVLPFSSVESEDTPPEGSTGKDSLTKNGDEVLVRAFPFTGRTHQIRLHCQYLGMPLRGDVKYGGPHVCNGVQYDHHALHAESLSFRHPFTSEDLFLVAPLPQWARGAGVQSLQE